MYDVLVSSVVYLPKKHNSIRNGRKGQLRVLLNSFHSMRLNTIRLICSPPHTHTCTGRQTHAHMRTRRLTGRQAETQATDVSGGITVWSGGVGSCSPTHTQTQTWQHVANHLQSCRMCKQLLVSIFCVSLSLFRMLFNAS